MIWCVEDDASIRDIELYALTSTGFEARGFDDGASFWEALQTETPELVLLDVMLPGEDGVSLLKKMKAAPALRDIPVIMATAKGAEYDKIQSLDLGADDYLVKPFALEELHARIRALLRRHNNQGESELIVGNLTLNMGRRQVWMGGEELILTPKEYALLSRLMLKAGSPVHREILYNDIYNWDNEPSTNTLEVHIHNLRDKVGKARIRTVRGFGYMLVANEEN